MARASTAISPDRSRDRRPAALDAGVVWWSARPICRSSPGACSAWARGTAPSRNPTSSREDHRWLVGSGNAAALAAGLVDLGLGTDTGCSIRLPSAACGTVGLKPRWGLAARWRLPARPDARHGRADGAKGRGRRAPLVGALGPRVPEPGSRASRSGSCGTARDRRRATDGASDAADAWAADLERSVPAWSSRGAPARGRHVAAFLHEAAQTHARRSPRARGVRPGDPPKLEAGLLVEPDAVAPLTTLHDWRRDDPTSTST